MIKKIGIAFICFIIVHLAHGQSIKAISFKGLKRTQEKYLYFLLDYKDGQSVSNDSIQYLKTRLANSQLFASIETSIITNENDTQTLIFNLKERNNILPYIFFGVGSDTGLLKVGAIDYNWLGKGNQLYANYTYYDRHSFSIGQTIYSIKQSKVGVASSFNKLSTVEPLFFPEGTSIYNYDVITLENQLIINLNHRKDLFFIGGGLLSEVYERQSVEDIGPQSSDLIKLLLKANYVHQKVNYHFELLDGVIHNIGLEHVITGDNTPTFTKLYSEHKLYKRIRKKGNFAGRLQLGLSSNNVGAFAPFLLDSFINVRGVGNRTTRATGQVVFNFEYRHTLFQFTNCDRPFCNSLQAVAFTDHSYWRTSGASFDDFLRKENIQTYAGLGLRWIFHKFNGVVLRIDYGVNVEDPRFKGFVFGLGQFF